MRALKLADAMLFLSTLSLRRATRGVILSLTLCPEDFYPRSPCGERPMPRSGHICKTHFYPRSPCGERLSERVPLAESTAISIHALLAESDYTHPIGIPIAVIISIHALLAESDAFPGFLVCGSNNFYPRSPCGERRNARPETRRRDAISIHALLAESDRLSRYLVGVYPYFYPRSPCGERRPTQPKKHQ